MSNTLGKGKPRTEGVLTEVTGGGRGGGGKGRRVRGGGGMMALVLRGFEWSRDVSLDLCRDIRPTVSLDTGETGSSLTEGSLGWVVAATASLDSGSEGDPPAASSAANLTEDCLASLLFEDFLDDTFLWALNFIEALAVTDLLIKDFCDTRILRPRNDPAMDSRDSFEVSENCKDRARSMFRENTGLKALGVSGNVWSPERTDSDESTREPSCAPVSIEIPPDIGCLDRRVPLRSAMIKLSSRSGLGLRERELDRLGKPSLVNADEGKEGSCDIW